MSGMLALTQEISVIIWWIDDFMNTLILPELIKNHESYTSKTPFLL